MNLRTVRSARDPAQAVNFLFLANLNTDETALESWARQGAGKILEEAWAREFESWINVHFLTGYFDFQANAGAGGIVLGDHVGAARLADQMLPFWEPQRDCVFVMTPGVVGRSSAHMDARAVMLSPAADWLNTLIHELGHAFAYLMDEYFGGSIRYPASGAEPRSPNVTRDPLGSKWKRFQTPGLALPTRTNDVKLQNYIPNLDKVVGSFEGAGNCYWGLYRSQLSCKMQNHAAPFCKVCFEAIRETFQRFTGGIFVPPTPPVLELVTVSFVNGLGGLLGTRSIPRQDARAVIHVGGSAWYMRTAEPFRYALIDEPLEIP